MRDARKVRIGGLRWLQFATARFGICPQRSPEEEISDPESFTSFGHKDGDTDL
jgi:hypothetical protein